MDEKERIKKLKQIKRLESMQKENMEKIEDIFRWIGVAGRVKFLWFKSLFSKKK